jgi:hypothetical protein
MGRQPWIVFRLMLTQNGVSPTVSVTQVRDLDGRVHPAVRRPGRGRGRLLMRAVKIGPPDSVESNYPDKVGEDRPLTVTY